jgi:hypothetical protein
MVLEFDGKITVRSFISSFFPLQIILGHLKYNLISLFYWALLFSICADSFGSAFGVPFLFFSPEYLGGVNNWAFLFVGFSVGGFIMAFNTYSYIKLGPRYPFLAAVSRPFFKFCINNSLIPISFIVFYLVQMINFQSTEEIAKTWDLIAYSLSFLAGVFGFILLSIFYFFPTTRDTVPQSSPDQSSNPIASVVQRKEKWYNYFRAETQKTYIYIGKGLKLYQSRSIRHLDREVIERVFAHNRINATIFEFLTIASFLILSFFKDHPFMEFPAAMSIVLLLTLIHMTFSFMMSWFHRWTYPIIIGVIFLMNFLSTRTEWFKYTNYAYGLDYTQQKRRDFSVENIRSNSISSGEIETSKNNFNQLLGNWKGKTGEDKPKLIIVNTSGGGSRSALWTLTVLQNCDQELNGSLSRNVQMITGASGGMVGAAYFREIMLRFKNKQITNPYHSSFKENLGKDLLNKLSFSASTNDIFTRIQTFEYNGNTYTKDRGYAFEEHLHENTENFLDHPIGYYKIPELEGITPVMIFTPTIVNDGRRLLISSQSLSFLTESTNTHAQLSNAYGNIDFQSFFKANDPQNLRFSTALRASATFPFIMPMVTMPTSPEMQLMDAGIRDNYGLKTTIEYLHSLENWIKENTSGVIILEIRDTKKILNNESYSKVSFLDKITMPFGNMYNNFPRTQDFDQEQLLKVALNGLPFSVDVVSFNLRENTGDRISLSWHLTKREKAKIEQAYFSLSNQNSLRRLKTILNTSKSN